MLQIEHLLTLVLTKVEARDVHQLATTRVQNAQSPGFHSQYHISHVLWCPSVIPALWSWEQ